MHVEWKNSFLDSGRVEGSLGLAVFGLFLFFLKKNYYQYIYHVIYVIMIKNPVWLAGQDTYQ